MLIENWAGLSTGILITIWNKHFFLNVYYNKLCIVSGIQNNHVSKQ